LGEGVAVEPPNLMDGKKRRQKAGHVKEREEGQCLGLRRRIYSEVRKKNKGGALRKIIGGLEREGKDKEPQL